MSPRIATLLQDRDGLRRDLEEAGNPDHAAAVMAELRANAHTLMLAGHLLEEVA